MDFLFFVFGVIIGGEIVYLWFAQDIKRGRTDPGQPTR